MANSAKKNIPQRMTFDEDSEEESMVNKFKQKCKLERIPRSAIKSKSTDGSSDDPKQPINKRLQLSLKKVPPKTPTSMQKHKSPEKQSLQDKLEKPLASKSQKNVHTSNTEAGIQCSYVQPTQDRIPLGQASLKNSVEGVRHSNNSQSDTFDESDSDTEKIIKAKLGSLKSTHAEIYASESSDSEDVQKTVITRNSPEKLRRVEFPAKNANDSDSSESMNSPVNFGPKVSGKIQKNVTIGQTPDLFSQTEYPKKENDSDDNSLNTSEAGSYVEQTNLKTRLKPSEESTIQFDDSDSDIVASTQKDDVLNQNQSINISNRSSKKVPQSGSKRKQIKENPVKNNQQVKFSSVNDKKKSPVKKGHGLNVYPTDDELMEENSPKTPTNMAGNLSKISENANISQKRVNISTDSTDDNENVGVSSYVIKETKRSPVHSNQKKVMNQLTSDETSDDEIPPTQNTYKTTRDSESNSSEREITSTVEIDRKMQMKITSKNSKVQKQPSPITKIEVQSRNMIEQRAESNEEEYSSSDYEAKTEKQMISEKKNQRMSLMQHPSANTSPEKTYRDSKTITTLQNSNSRNESNEEENNSSDDSTINQKQMMSAMQKQRASLMQHPSSYTSNRKISRESKTETPLQKRKPHKATNEEENGSSDDSTINEKQMMRAMQNQRSSLMQHPSAKTNPEKTSTTLQNSKSRKESIEEDNSSSDDSTINEKQMMSVMQNQRASLMQHPAANTSAEKVSRKSKTETTLQNSKSRKESIEEDNSSSDDSTINEKQMMSVMQNQRASLMQHPAANTSAEKVSRKSKTETTLQNSKSRKESIEEDNSSSDDSTINEKQMMSVMQNQRASLMQHPAANTSAEKVSRKSKTETTLQNSKSRKESIEEDNSSSDDSTINEKQMMSVMQNQRASLMQHPAANTSAEKVSRISKTETTLQNSKSRKESIEEDNSSSDDSTINEKQMMSVMQNQRASLMQHPAANTSAEKVSRKSKTETTLQNSKSRKESIEEDNSSSDDSTINEKQMMSVMQNQRASLMQHPAANTSAEKVSRKSKTDTTLQNSKSHKASNEEENSTSDDSTINEKQMSVVKNQRASLMQHAKSKLETNEGCISGDSTKNNVKLVSGKTKISPKNPSRKSKMENTPQNSKVQNKFNEFTSFADLTKNKKHLVSVTKNQRESLMQYQPANTDYEEHLKKSKVKSTPRNKESSEGETNSSDDAVANDKHLVKVKMSPRASGIQPSSANTSHEKYARDVKMEAIPVTSKSQNESNGEENSSSEDSALNEAHLLNVKKNQREDSSAHTNYEISKESKVKMIPRNSKSHNKSSPKQGLNDVISRKEFKIEKHYSSDESMSEKDVVGGWKNQSTSPKQHLPDEHAEENLISPTGNSKHLMTKLIKKQEPQNSPVKCEEINVEPSKVVSKKINTKKSTSNNKDQSAVRKREKITVDGHQKLEASPIESKNKQFLTKAEVNTDGNQTENNTFISDSESDDSEVTKGRPSMYDKLKSICDPDNENSKPAGVLNDIDKFKKHNRLSEIASYKPSIDLNDLDSDHELFVVHCPPLLDPSLLIGSTVNFDAKSKSKLKINNSTFEWKNCEKTETSSVLISSNASERNMQAKVLPVSGMITVSERLGTTPIIKLKPQISDKVSFPTELKVRHPLFGSDYTEQIVLENQTLRKLLEATTFKMKFLKKQLKNRRKSVHVSSDIATELEKPKSKRYSEYSDFIDNLSNNLLANKQNVSTDNSQLKVKSHKNTNKSFEDMFSTTTGLERTPKTSKIKKELTSPKIGKKALQKSTEKFTPMLNNEIKSIKKKKDIQFDKMYSPDKPDGTENIKNKKSKSKRTSQTNEVNKSIEKNELAKINTDGDVRGNATTERIEKSVELHMPNKLNIQKSVASSLKNKKKPAGDEGAENPSLPDISKLLEKVMESLKPAIKRKRASSIEEKSETHRKKRKRSQSIGHIETTPTLDNKTGFLNYLDVFETPAIGKKRKRTSLLSEGESSIKKNKKEDTPEDITNSGKKKKKHKRNEYTPEESELFLETLRNIKKNIADENVQDELTSLLDVDKQTNLNRDEVMQCERLLEKSERKKQKKMKTKDVFQEEYIETTNIEPLELDTEKVKRKNKNKHVDKVSSVQLDDTFEASSNIKPYNEVPIRKKKNKHNICNQ